MNQGRYVFTQLVDFLPRKLLNSHASLEQDDEKCIQLELKFEG